MSTSGRCEERAPQRGVGSVHNSSAQRSSISHPILAFGSASRSATAAGRAWTTSPIELRRTIKIRRRSLDCSWDDVASEVVIETTSRGPRREPGADDFAGRVILGIANDGNPSAVLAHGVGLGNAVGGVVGAFCLNVGMDFGNERAHVAFGENDNGINVGN